MGGGRAFANPTARSRRQRADTPCATAGAALCALPARFGRVAQMAGAVSTLSGRPSRFAGGLRELAPQTFAWLQPNGAWGEANAGLVVGAGESLLIDTLWDRRLAAAMLAAMAPALSSSPLRMALNTHQDGDHWWGNGSLPGGVEIITCAPARRGMDRESSPAQLARLARIAAVGRALPGSIGALGRQIHAMLSPFDFRDLRPRLPERAFNQSELELEVGGRPCKLYVLGPAHTPGDTIVHVGDVGVVFAADLLFAGAIPVMWHGSSSGWLSALDRMLELEAEIFVPGHGDVGDRGAVESMRRFWIWLRHDVQELRARSPNALAITESLIRSDGFAEWRHWECPERLLITVAGLLRELDGKPPIAVTALQRAKLFRQVAILEERIAQLG
jgi:cyclase